VFSFEFFPPKTDEGELRLWESIRALEALRPGFVSVTYGAGGSTRDRTVRLTRQIAEHSTLTPLAHLTCVDASVADLRGVIGAYADAGVRNVLALRGDPPGGAGLTWIPRPDGLPHAVDLVSLLRKLGDFAIGVAAFPEGHPQSSDLQADARVLAAKQEAGASFAITQFFFRCEDYERLRERATAHGCTIPLVPGLMPVTDVGQIVRFAALSGAEFPADLQERFAGVAGDPDAVVDLGVEIGTELAARLLAAGAPGIHFYTLNRSTATRRIHANLQPAVSGVPASG